MFERPAAALALAAIVVGCLLVACASGEPAAPGPAAARRVVSRAGARIRPPRQSRRPRCGGAPAWLARQAAARRGAARRARAGAAPAAARLEKGTPGKLLIFSSVTGRPGRRRAALRRWAPPKSGEASAPRSSSARSRRSAIARAAAGGGRRGLGPPPSAPAGRNNVLTAPAAPAAPDWIRQLHWREHDGSGGKLGQPEDLPVLRRSLDADGNGRPEESATSTSRRTSCCAARKTATSTVTPDRGAVTRGRAGRAGARHRRRRPPR